MNEIDRWLANLDLELSGASLNPLEGFVLGGDVFNLTELRDILTQAKEARRQAFEEAAKACEAERLCEPQDDSDAAYDNAIDHCVQAIRTLASDPSPSPPPLV